MKRRLSSKQFRQAHSPLFDSPTPGGRVVKPAVAPRELLILIPAFNEVGAISGVVREVRGVMLGVPILVVDDASTDGTGQSARSAGADVLRLPYHLGLGGGVQAGYKLAYELGYEYVIRVDGDGQHDPKYIPDLLKALRDTGCHMVIASRFQNGNGGSYTSTVRAIGIWFFRLVLRPILGKPVRDPTSGFVGVNREALQVFTGSFPSGIPGDRGAGGFAAQTLPVPRSALPHAPAQDRTQHDHRGKIAILHLPRPAGSVRQRAEV